MPLFKVSVESVVPVSAVVTSSAVLMEDAVAEVRLLQARARVNWKRGTTPIGSISGDYEIWAHGTRGNWTVSLSARIPVSATQSVIADDATSVADTVSSRQSSGLVKWLYRGVPIGDFKEPIPTAWSNQQANLVTAAIITANGGLYPGQAVVLSSTVTASETPVGNLEFRDSNLGLVTTTALEADPVTAGVAHATAVVNLPEGEYFLTANYVGSDGFQPTTSDFAPVTIAKLVTNVNITPPTPPIFAGQQIHLAVTIVHFTDGAPAPTGVVTLFNAGMLTILDTAILKPGGLASFDIGNLPPDIYSFEVQYDGDAVHAGHANTIFGVQVQQATTSSVLTIFKKSVDTPTSTSVFSETVRLRTVVTSVVAGTVPTGSVNFFHDSVFIGAAILAPSGSNSATAELLINNLSVAFHTITASYAGSASFAPSNPDPASITVSQARTFVNASSTNSPTKRGQAAVFDAVIGTFDPAESNPFNTYGTAASVNYKDTTLTTVHLDGSQHATRSNALLPVGVSEIGVSFLATTEFAASSTSFPHTVVQGDTNTTVAMSSPSPIHWSQDITVSATVHATAPATEAAGAPTGTVSFSVADNVLGTFFLGTVAVTSNTASLFVSHNSYQIFALFFGAPLIGTLTATYSGEVSFKTSHSAALSYVVLPF